jgi:oligopeptide/dipeptide ABC transporter ATP-binding protein
MSALLEIRGLSVDFGSGAARVPIIEDVDLHVAKGETLGIVGESGCGKSTTAFAVLRLLDRSARARVRGQILFDGRDILQLGERDMRKLRGRHIAMIPQDPMSSLNPLFRVGDQIAEALRAHGVIGKKEIRAAAIRSLERLNIDSPATRLGQYPHELSGGMRQRVVGAIAMACSPRLLIADEPTTALDATVQAQYLDVLANLQRESGMAMMFVTHDLGVIARICNRVAVMYAGRLVECAPVRDIFETPAHWYTKALLDSMPAMDRQVSRLASIEGTPPRPTDQHAGCRFAPRCPAAQARCREQEPPVDAIDGKRAARCWFPRSGADT